MGNKPKIFPGQCEMVNEDYEANVELKFIRKSIFYRLMYHEVSNEPKIFIGQSK